MRPCESPSVSPVSDAQGSLMTMMVREPVKQGCLTDLGSGACVAFSKVWEAMLTLSMPDT